MVTLSDGLYVEGIGGSATGIIGQVALGSQAPLPGHRVGRIRQRLGYSWGGAGPADALR